MVTTSVMAVLLPAASVTARATELAAGVSMEPQLMLVGEKLTALPLQVALVTPESASVMVPVAVKVGVVMIAPFAGEVIVRTGGVLSILMPVTMEAGLLFPATSLQVPD